MCMMMEDELKRQGKLYFDVAKSLVQEYPKDFPPGVSIKTLTYIHFPIYGNHYHYFIVINKNYR